MAHNVEIGGISYIPTHEAAKAVGYTSDYVCKLAREQKIAAKRVGRFWFVDPISLEKFYSIANRERKERNEKLRTVRKLERKEKTAHFSFQMPQNRKLNPQIRAFFGATATIVTGLAVGFIFYSSLTIPFDTHMMRVISLYGETQKMARQTNHALSGIALNLKSSANIFSSPGNQQIASHEGNREREGVVVVPSTTPQTEIDRIHESFSDEVDVSFDDPDSTAGVITPIFRERDGDQFRFLLVPVKEKEDS